MIYMKLFYCVTIHFHCVEKNMIKTLLSISFYGRQKIENHLGLEQHESIWQNSIFGWTISSIRDEIKDFKEMKDWPDSEWIKCRTGIEEELIGWHLNKAYTRTSTKQTLNLSRRPGQHDPCASSHFPTGAC